MQEGGGGGLVASGETQFPVISHQANIDHTMKEASVSTHRDNELMRPLQYTASMQHKIAPPEGEEHPGTN